MAKWPKILLLVMVIVCAFITSMLPTFAFGGSQVYISGPWQTNLEDIYEVPYIKPLVHQVITFGTSSLNNPLSFENGVRYGYVELYNGTFNLSPYISGGDVVIDPYNVLTSTQNYIYDYRDSSSYTYAYSTALFNGLNSAYENDKRPKPLMYLDIRNQFNIDSLVQSLPEFPSCAVVSANDFLFDFSISSNFYSLDFLGGSNGIGGITIDGGIPLEWYEEALDGSATLTMDYIRLSDGYEGSITYVMDLENFIVGNGSVSSRTFNMPLIPFEFYEHVGNIGSCYIKDIKCVYRTPAPFEVYLPDTTETGRGYLKTYIHTPYLLTGEWVNDENFVPTDDNVGQWNVVFKDNAIGEVLGNRLRYVTSEATKYNNPYTGFIATSVNGIMDAEIMEGFTIGGIFSMCVALGIVFAVLKYFAGG